MFRTAAVCIVTLFAARAVGRTMIGVTCRLAARRALRQTVR